ncbi:MAG: 4-hydroxy-tetrahydrodipicolinate synthase, partial [Clostridiales bacterium]|nr:4-hydroxy-tetrahydrodipicolinate synthase [Clostridiales bacterium]
MKGNTAERLDILPVQPWPLCAKALRLSSVTDGALSTVLCVLLWTIGALADFFYAIRQGEAFMGLFTGSGVALVTPFTDDGSVNYEKLTELIEFQLKNNTDALIICGTTGEASTLTDDEQIETIRVAVRAANKRAPVIAGAGSNYTDHGVELCVRSQAAGADGVMLVTPYYNKTTPKGLIEHYTRIALSIDLPIIVYNVPSRTGLNITPKTAKALSNIDNVTGIKEASGNIAQVAEIIEFCGDKLDVYAGNDDYIVPVMSLGGKGVISTAANIIPRQIHDMTDKFINGRIAAAAELQLGI